MKRGFSPLDRRLGLVQHSWTPQTIEHAVRLGVEIPSLRRAAASFAALTWVPLGKSSLQNLLQKYGGILVSQQGEEAEAAAQVPTRETTVCPRLEPEPDAQRMSVGLDGVMVNIREEGWKEVKLATFSAVEVRQAAGEGDAEVQLSRHSYRAGLWDAAQFAKQQGAEGYRRGLEKVKELIAVSDAAAWIWAIIVQWYAPCVQIIDWWHAVQRVWTITGAVYGEGTAQTQAWFRTLQAYLWVGDMQGLLHALRAKWPRGKEMPETLRQAVGYLYRHRQRMHYREYRQKGYPIGSGSTESACKVVVQERLVQAGMRWSRVGAQAMLALRCALLSNRWEATWGSLWSAKVA